MSTDDSICESSLNPNKSSGDIVERLRNRLQRDRRGNFDPELSLRLGPGIYEEIMESAAEIERLRREVEEVKGDIAWDRYHYAKNIRGTHEVANEVARHWKEKAEAAESAVAAAYENAAKIAEQVGNFGDYKREELTPDFGQPRFDMMTAIASAIRAAGAEKTAESGHSPSTLNTRTE